MKRIAMPMILSLTISTLIACGSDKSNSNKAETIATKQEQKEEVQQGPVVQKPVIDLAKVMEAALNGDLASIEKALADGYDVNATDPDLHTALMMAAYNGHSSVIKLLLDKGAAPDMKDLMDRTALMYASTGAFNETVVLLLEAGAKINLVDNEEHFTALMFAAAEGQAEVVKTLLKAGADNSLLDVDGESAYDFAMANGHLDVAALLK